MWSISDLKSRAWAVLSRTYWKIFAVTLLVNVIVNFATGIGNTILKSIFNLLDLGLQIGQRVMEEAFWSTAFSPRSARFLCLYMLASIPVSLVIVALVRGPATTALNGFYMWTRTGNTNIDTISLPLQTNYKHIAVVSFFRSLRLILWSLLLVVPGIVKKYEYSMIPYIMAENPSLSCERAFALSRDMTSGEKWKMFVLDLSFIGWYLLCLFTCMIGTMFLIPYLNAVKAELYAAMRDKVLYLSLATTEELPGFGPHT